MANLTVNHKFDPDLSHVTRCFCYFASALSLSAVSCGCQGLTLQTFGLEILCCFSEDSCRVCDRSRLPPRVMADPERSPLLSEQHDGTNGLSPGGSYYGYPSKPQSMFAVSFKARARVRLAYFRILNSTTIDSIMKRKGPTWPISICALLAS